MRKLNYYFIEIFAEVYNGLGLERYSTFAVQDNIFFKHTLSKSKKQGRYTQEKYEKS